MLKFSFNFAAFKKYRSLLSKHLLNRLKIFKSWFVKQAQKVFPITKTSNKFNSVQNTLCIKCTTNYGKIETNNIRKRLPPKLIKENFASKRLKCE